MVFVCVCVGGVGGGSVSGCALLLLQHFCRPSLTLVTCAARETCGRAEQYGLECKRQPRVFPRPSLALTPPCSKKCRPCAALAAQTKRGLAQCKVTVRSNAQSCSKTRNVLSSVPAAFCRRCCRRAAGRIARESLLCAACRQPHYPAPPKACIPERPHRRGRVLRGALTTCFQGAA
jgi:hypothetical protein